MSAPCIICQSVTNKYKCSKCKEPYCSLNCYKEHQQQECTAKELVSDKHAATATPAEVDDEPTLHDPFKTEDTVPLEKLKELSQSEELKNLLYNPHLRNFLNEVDIAPNAWKSMRVAMQEPLFIEFADACLKIIEPPTPEEQQELTLG